MFEESGHSRVFLLKLGTCFPRFAASGWLSGNTAVLALLLVVLVGNLGGACAIAGLGIWTSSALLGVPVFPPAV